MGWIPSEEEALELLKKEKTPEQVINHSKAVTELVKRTLKGMDVDKEVIVAGSILHDIGRSKTHEVNHGIMGGNILRKHGVDERVARIAETHVGAGIPKDEAVKLGFPAQDFIPTTLEEKIVCYADKLLMGTSIATEAEVLYDFRKKLGETHPAIKRMKKLFQEMRKILEVKE